MLIYIVWNQYSSLFPHNKEFDFFPTENGISDTKKFIYTSRDVICHLGHFFNIIQDFLYYFITGPCFIHPLQFLRILIRGGEVFLPPIATRTIVSEIDT